MKQHLLTPAVYTKLKLQRFNKGKHNKLNNDLSSSHDKPQAKIINDGDTQPDR